MNKKEETDFNEKKFDFSEFLGTEKGKAALKLFGFFIFFGVVIAYANIRIANAPKKSVPKDEESSSFVDDSSSEDIPKNIDIDEMKNNLLSNSYAFTFTIYQNDTEKISYQGRRNGNYFEGYKLTETEFTKFFMENGKIYEDRLNGKIESKNVFKNIDINYLDTEYIINYIKNFEYEKNEKETYTEYIYNVNKNTSIMLRTDEAKIFEFEISFKNKTYNKYLIKI